MTVVEDEAELVAALASSRRIARAAFDDDRLLLERYLSSPRHVEVQVMADAHGSVIHLGERDCSLQRRHQKLMEETPAPNLDPRIRDRLCESAVAIVSQAGYVGAGTCEFLVARDGTFGFIEMNARLQVEHPVTEMVTGLDLVELQLRAALGEALPVSQDEVRADGHAVEVRVYAEDPGEQFLPQTGRVLYLRWPQAARVDTGIEEGSEVTADYDPLVAKIVVHGQDRAAAVYGLRRALADTVILGPRTNIAFLGAMTRDETVADGRITTDWLETVEFRGPVLEPAAAAAAAAAEVEHLTDTRSWDPWSRLRADAATVVLRPDGVEQAFTVRRGDPVKQFPMARTDDAWLVWSDGAQHEIPVGPAPRRIAESGAAHLGSPLPGQVIAVRVGGGDHVRKNDELVVVEAMKMEHAVRAPADGTVTAVLCAAGEKVDRGQALVDFEPDATS